MATERKISIFKTTAKQTMGQCRTPWGQEIMKVQLTSDWITWGEKQRVSGAGKDFLVSLTTKIFAKMFPNYDRFSI